MRIDRDKDNPVPDKSLNLEEDKTTGLTCDCNMYKLKGECWHVGSYKPILYEKV